MMENNNIEKTGTVVGWLEKLLELGHRYSWKDWLEVLSIIFILGVFVLVWSRPEKVISFFQRAVQEQHQELLDKRQETSFKVQQVCDKLLYETGADRVVVLELHNSISNLAGVPFLKASCTTEALRDSIYPIASQYQSTSLSLMPFSTYLYQVGYWSGETKVMATLDRSLSYRMLSNSTEYFCAGIVPGTDRPIGFIFVSYCNGKRPEDTAQLKSATQKAALQLGVLLELRK